MLSINQILKEYSIPIKQVLIENGLIKNSGNLIENLGFKAKNILLVGDQNTSVILQNIRQNITNNFTFELIFDQPNAAKENCDLIYQKSEKIDLIIAVGSGTINDLCKLASFQRNIPYIVFASAPSMNGYASSNVSILINGHKKSILARQAMAIYFDLDVAVSAPQDLIKAGIGDSLCYYTCHFDWLLSHLVLGTNFNHEIFAILEPYQQKLIDFKGNLNDPEFIKTLCEILTISGLAMYLCNGSYPASQGEHLIAHFLEMKYPKILKQYFHGTQIAATTLTMLDIQHEFLKKTKLELKSYDFDINYFENLFDGDKKIASECLKEIEPKKQFYTKLVQVNKNLEEVKVKLKEVTIERSKILGFYDRFNIAKELKIEQKIYHEAVENCYLIRNRFTALDFKN